MGFTSDIDRVEFFLATMTYLAFLVTLTVTPHALGLSDIGLGGIKYLMLFFGCYSVMRTTYLFTKAYSDSLIAFVLRRECV